LGRRTARGARAVDLLTAAVASSVDLALCTRNPADVTGLGDLWIVIDV
jgi:predicted nucleic acid-binding protein